MLSRHSVNRILAFIAPLVLAAACASYGNSGTRMPSAPADLVALNSAINQQGRFCARDYCLEDWPEAIELDTLTEWDCKAYAVAKAARLLSTGYAPTRLEYVLIDGPPLRVTHAALLVDGRWVLDIGVRCQVCELDQFRAGLRVSGRLPVTELPYLRRALRAAGS